MTEPRAPDLPHATARRRVTALNFFPAFLPPTSGGELRYYHIYRNLGRHYDVHLLSPTHPFVAAETLPMAEGVVEHRVPKSQRHVTLQRLFDALAGFPECSAVVVSLASYLEHGYRSLARDLCSRADVVVHEFPFLFAHARKRSGQLLVYDAHNVEFDMQRSMLRGPLGWLLCRYVKQLERLACRESDVVFATSADDRRRLVSLYGISPEKVFVAPNGVDVTAIRFVSDAERAETRRQLDIGPDDRVLLFVGSFHPPNIEAVKYLIAGLAPRLTGTTLLIAGSVTRAVPAAGVPDNVVCLGRVSDAAKTMLLRASDVALNPMFSGSGTNLKMLEYLAAGVPVVATPIGVRGLDVVDDEHVVVSAADRFPESIGRVLADRDLRGRLRARGRQLVEERYDWGAIVETMRGVLEAARARSSEARATGARRSSA